MPRREDDVLGAELVDKLVNRLHYGRTPDGGNMGTSDVEEDFTIKPSVYKSGTDSWIVGQPVLSDMPVATIAAGTTDAELSINAKLHHVILGFTRGGKGAGQVIPNILRTQPGQSFVAFDPKAESYMVCAQALEKQGKRVVLIDPMRVVARRLGVDSVPHQCAYNPLGEINQDSPEASRMITELANVLIEKPKAGSGGSEYWYRLTVNVTKALLAFALFYRPPATSKVVARMRDEERDEPTMDEKREIYHQANIMMAANFAILPRDTRETMIQWMLKIRDRIKQSAANHGHRPRFPRTLRMIEAGAADADHLLGSNSDKEGMRSLLTMLTSNFGWIDSPELEEDLRGLDFAFRFSDLKKEENIAVFVVIPDTALESHGAYLRMVFTAMLNSVCSTEWAKGVNPKRHMINVMFDECPVAGYMPALLRAFSLGYGYGVRIIAIGQNKTQFDDVYGPAVTAALLNNAVTVYLGGNDAETPEYFARILGEMFKHDEREDEDRDEKVQVFTPAEILRLVHPSRHLGIVIEGGRGAVIFRKRFYFDYMKAGVHYTQTFEHASLEDQLFSHGKDESLLSLPRGTTLSQEGDEDDEPEHFLFDGVDEMPLIEHQPNS